MVQGHKKILAYSTLLLFGIQIFALRLFDAFFFIVRSFVLIPAVFVVFEP